MKIGILALLAALAATACASKPPPAPPPPPPPKAVLVIATRPDVNPDDSGRPSPVVMRIYQLKGDAAFVNSTFGTLFEDERKALGADLIVSDEYQLIPGERRTVELAPPPGLRYVGAVAAFHDVRNSSWRAVLPVPPGGWGDTRIEVTADTTRLRIQLGH
jgi:type VI secretion system protein VasD